MKDSTVISYLKHKIYHAESDDAIYVDCVRLKGLKDALDLINRQKAEIENLKIYSENLEISQEHLLSECAVARKTAKSEAIKEFAVMLKSGVPQETGVIRCADVDNLVKEMTEAE